MLPETSQLPVASLFHIPLRLVITSGAASVIVSILVQLEKSLPPSFSQKGPFSPLGEAEGKRNNLRNGVITLMPQTQFFPQFLHFSDS